LRTRKAADRQAWRQIHHLPGFAAEDDKKWNKFMKFGTALPEPLPCSRQLL
jgi:hypothetical protein